MGTHTVHFLLRSLPRFAVRLGLENSQVLGLDRQNPDVFFYTYMIGVKTDLTKNFDTHLEQIFI